MGQYLNVIYSNYQNIFLKNNGIGQDNVYVGHPSCFKFAPGSQINIPLDIDAGRALRLAGGGLLFFGTGFIRHCVAAGALVVIMQDNPCLRVLGDGIFGTGEGTIRFLTVVAK